MANILTFKETSFGQSEEGCAYIEVVTDLVRDTAGAVTADFTYTDDLDAVQDEHYKASVTGISYADGISGEKTWYIPTIYTGLDDDKAFTLSLTNEANCTLGTPSSTTCFIQRTFETVLGDGKFSTGDINWVQGVPSWLSTGLPIDQTGGTVSETYKEFDNKQIKHTDGTAFTLENSEVHNYDVDLVDLNGTHHVFIRNNYLHNSNPSESVGSPTAGVYVNGTNGGGNVEVLGNLFEDTEYGGRFTGCGGDDKLHFLRNHGLNLVSKEASNYSHFFALEWSTYVTDCQVSFNTNYLDPSIFSDDIGDSINTYESSADSSSPMLIECNTLYGMGLSSAFGIIIGDNYTQNSGYIKARYNVIPFSWRWRHQYLLW